MLDLIALWIGRAMMVAGGVAGAAYLLWQCVELFLRRTRNAKVFLQWYFEAVRAGRMKPPPN